MHPIKKIIKYPNRISRAAMSLAPKHRDRLEALKADGCLVIPEAIDPGRLCRIQDIYRTVLEKKCRFKSPCLGQNLIDQERHKDLIERHFLCSSNELEKRQLTFNVREGMQYDEVIARFNPSTVTVLVTQIQELFKDWLNEEILALGESYMGVTPFLTEAYIRRNFPAKYKVMNHFWHRDVNQPDFVLKAFVFLSDCALDNGPHEFVRGSVHSSLFPGGDYVTDENIDATFPPGSEHRIVSVVKAGTIILEDTSGLHRAIVPQTGYRDLGYAVFVPRPFYLRPQKPLYKMGRSIFQSLSAYQQKFVPSENIN